MADTVELDLFDAKGKKVGKKKVPASIFEADVAGQLLHQVVRWQRAKKRAGTHSVLTRAEVRGGGRKPWLQKGLGRARAGTNSSPIWVGGGVAHGPKPRSYEFRLNKKERRAALCSAISVRKAEGKCLALKDFELAEIKSKQAQAVLENLGITRGVSAVVVASAEDANVSLSVRNLPRVKALPAQGLNVYDVLDAEYLVVTEKALEGITSRLIPGE